MKAAVSPLERPRGDRRLAAALVVPSYVLVFAAAVTVMARALMTPVVSCTKVTRSWPGVAVRDRARRGQGLAGAGVLACRRSR